MLRRFSIFSYQNQKLFQSSPDPEAGCYEVCQMLRPMQYQFQSSPDPEAGCYDIGFCYYRDVGSFNPHPTRRPGATALMAS